MSRRESRVSDNIRQKDALLEFENFKKRFLLANKHITKLNSTLSVKVEELNAQVSALYVENLRLRSSEIALSAQLKREREKSRSIMADAEAATMTLMKHLESLRESYKVPSGRFTPKSTPSPPPIRRRPLANHTSPAIPKIARAPNIPEIREEDEQDEAQISHSRRKTSSRLPVPSRRSSSPTAIEPEQSPTKNKRKASRRQSGMLNPSRVCDSPVPTLLIAELALAQTPPSEEQDEPFPIFKEDDDIEIEIPKKKKKSKKRDREEDNVLLVIEGSTSKLKDVTNSPQSRAFLPPLDINIAADLGSQLTSDLMSEAPTSATSVRTTSTRAFLTTPATTPAPTTPADPYLPTPRGSSSTPPPQDVEITNNVTGREKRVRKSVNYAEPKLNTKMRKPDATPNGKRSSQASREGTPPPSQSRSSSSSPSDQAQSRRKKSIPPTENAVDDIMDTDEDDGDEADAEYGGIGRSWVGVSERRRRSGQVSRSRSGMVAEARRHSLAV